MVGRSGAERDRFIATVRGAVSVTGDQVVFFLDLRLGLSDCFRVGNTESGGQVGLAGKGSVSDRECPSTATNLKISVMNATIQPHSWNSSRPFSRAAFGFP
jgi:hypothetical protein